MKIVSQIKWEGGEIIAKDFKLKGLDDLKKGLDNLEKEMLKEISQDKKSDKKS